MTRPNDRAPGHVGGPRPALLALLVVLGAAGTACDRPSGAAESTEEPSKAISVSVAPVRVAPMSELYASSATLRAEQEASVTARTRGVVERLRAEEGDWVEAGQVLAELEDDEQRIELERVLIARETRRAEFARAEALHAKGLMSDEDFELKRRESREAENAADKARLALSRTAIRAPFAGRVLRRHVDVGATVSDGTAVFDIADLDPIQADVGVPERHVARLAPGQAVRLVAGATGEVAAARIERIAPGVDPKSGTVKVTISTEAAGELRPGAFVRVEVVTSTHERAHVVPRTALVADGRRWHLFRLDESGGSVEKVHVQPGFQEGELVELLGEGGGPSPVAAGDRIVVLGAPALSDGARVQVVEDRGEPGDEDDGSGADSERS